MVLQKLQMLPSQGGHISQCGCKFCTFATAGVQVCQSYLSIYTKHKGIAAENPLGFTNLALISFGMEQPEMLPPAVRITAIRAMNNISLKTKVASRCYISGFETE